jgi:tetratricopeptide (TPR) repeat protein
MTPDKNTRDIQAYLRGTLPSVRRAKFEARLQNDAAFNAQFLEMKPLFEAIDEINLENRIKEIISDKEAKIEELDVKIDKPQRPIEKLFGNSIVRYAVAASMVILLVIFWHDFTMSSRVYEKFYEPENTDVRGHEIAECPDKNTLVLYYQGNYKSILNLLAKKPVNPCNDYYKGLCYMELGDFQKAILSFNVATKSSEIIIKQRAEWYLGLAFLKNDEPEKSKEMMKKIINTPEHQYEVLAKDLLDELNKKPILF